MSVFIHVSVAIRDQDRLLFVQEGRTDNDRFGCWNLPGGRLEAGETLPEGARREVSEETGLDVTLTGLVGIYSDRRDLNRHAVRFVFSAPHPGGIAVPGDEILAVRWFIPSEVDEMADDLLINPYLLRRVAASDGVLPCFPLEMLDEPDNSPSEIKP